MKFYSEINTHSSFDVGTNFVLQLIYWGRIPSTRGTLVHFKRARTLPEDTYFACTNRTLDCAARGLASQLIAEPVPVREGRPPRRSLTEPTPS